MGFITAAIERRSSLEGYVGIFDTDKRYRECLMRGLMRAETAKLPLVEFTSLDSICVFAEEKHLDLLLVSDIAVTNEIINADIGRIVLLCEEPDMEGTLSEGGMGHIFKYQPIARIASDLWCEYNIISPLKEEAYPRPVNSIIYGVYSPIKRCFKTGFSVALASVLGENSHVLLVTFEENSTILEMLDFSAGMGDENLSDALYYYLQGNLIEHVDNLVKRAHGFDFILPAGNAEDIEGLAPETVIGFIKYFLYECNYAYVVVDFGDRLCKIGNILSCCDRIFMPVISDWISEAKKGHFLDYVRGTEDGLLTHIQEVRPPRSHISSTGRETGVGNFERLFRTELFEYVRTCL